MTTGTLAQRSCSGPRLSPGTHGRTAWTLWNAGNSAKRPDDNHRRDAAGRHPHSAVKPDLPGFVRGRPIHTFVDEVKELGYTEAAITLLLELVDATEADSRANGWGVAPWYFERLAIIYRSQKRLEDEVKILERYERQQKAPGSMPAKLATRLRRAKDLSSR